MDAPCCAGCGKPRAPKSIFCHDHQTKKARADYLRYLSGQAPDVQEVTRPMHDWEAIARVLAKWSTYPVDIKTGKRNGPFSTLYTQGRKFKTQRKAIEATLDEAMKEVAKHRRKRPGPPDPKHCPMCGAEVVVASGDEGTCHYEPLARARLDRVIGILAMADDPGHKPHHEVIKYALDAAMGKGE